MNKSIRMVVLLLFFLYQNCIQLSAQQSITGTVVEVSGAVVVIDRGADDGVQKQAEGIVYYRYNVSEQTVRLNVARVKVSSVGTRTSRLQVIDKTADIQKGYQVDMQVLPQPQRIPAGERPISEKPPKKSKKKWYIIAGVVLVGGAIAVAAAGGDESSKEPDTGSITVVW